MNEPLPSTEKLSADASSSADRRDFLQATVAAGAALAFVDPEEMTLVLTGASTVEVLPLSFQASTLSLVISGFAALVAAAAQRQKIYQAYALNIWDRFRALD